MNQFKDHFWEVQAEFPTTTCQKCLRTGDIDNWADLTTTFRNAGKLQLRRLLQTTPSTGREFLTGKRYVLIPPAFRHGVSRRRRGGIWMDEVGLPPDRVSRLDEDETSGQRPSQGPDGVAAVQRNLIPQFVGRDLESGVHTVHRVGLRRTTCVRCRARHRHRHGIRTDGVGAAGRRLELPHRHLARWRERRRGLRRSLSAGNGKRTASGESRTTAGCTFAIHENVYPGPNKEKYVIKRLRRAVLDAHQMGRANRYSISSFRSWPS